MPVAAELAEVRTQHRCRPYCGEVPSHHIGLRLARVLILSGRITNFPESLISLH